MLTDENIQSFSNSEDNIAREDIQIIKEFLNDGLSVIVASNIIFKILEDIQKLDKEGLLIPFNIDSIKSYANINDKEAARLVSSVNEVIDRCIAYPDFSSDNSIIGKNR